MPGPGKGVEIGVNRESETPLCEQITAQIAFLIGARRLEPGAALPSVRALAKRLAVHYNTVSQAYQDLASAGLVAGHRGGRMMVCDPDELADAGRGTRELDDLINDTLRRARQQGYTLRQVRQRVRERLLESPPNRFLVVSEEAGMRVLLRTELAQAVDCPVEACCTAELAANPRLAFGAVVLAPPGTMAKALAVLPKSQPAVAVQYSDSSAQMEAVRALKKPSVIAVVSISEFFLEIARGVLSPAIGRRHSIAERLIAAGEVCDPGGADVLICDCVARSRLRVRDKRTVIMPYRLLSGQCLSQAKSLIEDLADAAR